MLRSFVPESNTLRRSIISLARNSDRHMYPKSTARPMSASEYDQTDGPDMYDEVDSGVSPEEQLSKGWRRRTAGTSAWIDVWSVPVIILNLFYKYHPIPWENETTRRINQQCNVNNTAREPLDLSPDIFTIELEAGPSAIRLLGNFWRQFFIGFKVSVRLSFHGNIIEFILLFPYFSTSGSTLWFIETSEKKTSVSMFSGKFV